MNIHTRWRQVAIGLIACCAVVFSAHSDSARHEHHTTKPRYLNAAQIEWVPLLAPPPAADSLQQRRDLQAVLDAQAANSSGERHDRAIADAEASCFRFADVFSDVLGTAFNARQLPVTAAFLDRAANEGNAASSILKRYWQRPRPFVVNNKVVRLADIAPQDADPKLTEQQLAASQHTFEYSSYPSGHATYGTLCGIFLSQMLPEKQAQLFQRAVEYGESRLIVGAHFPSDLLAGRIVATAAVAAMSQNKLFQHDLQAARAELRRAIEISMIANSTNLPRQRM